MSDASADRLGETMRWALDAEHDPSMAAADWLASDIDARYRTVVELLGDPEVALASIVAAKEAFKTMRLVGETAADRRLGARLYAASIAAAFAHHGERISTQSDRALARAFGRFAEDPAVHPDLRELAGRARARLEAQHRGG